MKNMIVVKSTQMTQGGGQLETFKLLPVNSYCPFISSIYDIVNSRLMLLHKDVKSDLEVVPKLNEKGEMALKNGQPIAERRTIENYYESAIEDRESIIEFVKTMAINSEDTKIFMPYLAGIIPTKATMEKPASLIIQ